MRQVLKRIYIVRVRVVVRVRDMVKVRVIVRVRVIVIGSSETASI